MTRFFQYSLAVCLLVALTFSAAAADPGKTMRLNSGVALVERRLYLRLRRSRLVGVVAGPCAICGSIEHVVRRGSISLHLAQAGGASRYYYRTSVASVRAHSGLKVRRSDAL